MYAMFMNIIQDYVIVIRQTCHYDHILVTTYEVKESFPLAQYEVVFNHIILVPFIGDACLRHIYDNGSF